ncbi:uncharacterized protein LOC123701548 [Colias croceus]|uniref:uncharacterized protein LOC123701548 n=1 Tax=Colias crocea TaxID=72248 RepID=UPI001E27F33A|nr:uncharacterized protein LOC123701548 [Colias croceus]
MKVFCQAFADDIVLVFDGDTGLEIEVKANRILGIIDEWGIRNKLKFAPHKTCALLSTRKLKYDKPRLTMGSVDIQYFDNIKILGLIIDGGLTFNDHVGNVCKKAIARYKLLARAARVSWGLNPQVVKTIYIAVIEPTILYASAAWAPTAEKMGVQKRLNTVQRGFAQKICRAYRTVSLNSAMLLAGILPLDLRILEASRLYEIGRGVSHPAVLRDREVERMAPAIEDPHPAEQVELGFGLVDEDTYADVVDSHVHRVYTDGSKIEGRVGAALSVWKGEAETKAVKLALPPYCTVYQAELLALKRAVDIACKSGAAKVGVFSDSRSALQAVTLSSRHPLAVQTRAALRNAALQRREVSLFWIKAHAGLKGNERADELAKEAALGLRRKPDYDLCPVSFVKRILRQDTISEWDRRYDVGGTAGVTKLFFPSAAAAYKVVGKIDITHHTTQVLTGHGGFAFYLNRFKLKDNPSCLCQPGVEETVPHLLLECPIFASNRYAIEQKLGMAMTGENLPSALGDKCRDAFLQYCRNIVVVVNQRNSV